MTLSGPHPDRPASAPRECGQPDCNQTADEQQVQDKDDAQHRRMIRTRGRRSTRVGCAPPGFRRFRRGVFPRLDPGVERADECSRLMGEGLSSGYGVQDQVPARVRWRMSGCAAQLLRVAVERVDRTPDRRIGSRMSVAGYAVGAVMGLFVVMSAGEVACTMSLRSVRRTGWADRSRPLAGACKHHPGADLLFWPRDGLVWPDDHEMPTHEGCTCIPVTA